MTSNRHSVMKRAIVTAALVAGLAGTAYADDNSMNPYTGDSYAYFNGGRMPQRGQPVVSPAPSTFRQTNPHGLPLSTYAAEASANAPALNPAQPVDRAPSSFRSQYPNGLPLDYYEDLSSSNGLTRARPGSR
jgi:hypothetical protein